MLKSVIFTFLAALTLSQAAMANRLTEPVLMAPFAREVEIPEACESAIVQATRAATADLKSAAAGESIDAKVYKITVGGLLYSGSDLVFEAIRIVGQLDLMDRAKVRGDLYLDGNQCVVKNARSFKMFNAPYQVD